jgi:hypothetical protein
MPKKQKEKPVIPEPSPQMLSWSLVAGAMLILAVLLFDYASGWLQ